MGRFLTSDDFIAQFGEREAQAIAGTNDFNSLEGSQIDHTQIEDEIAFVDELIAGYVLARHLWLRDLDVSDVPNLLKGLGGDIVRYRLRDKQGGKGQVSETVDKRHSDALKRLEAIQSGKLDLPRDRADGEDLVAPELPASSTDAARISGPPSQAAALLEGY
jgi:phage gp36-like protein